MLYELIRYYRQKRGLSPKEMARRLGVSYVYYNRLEKPYEEGRAVPSEDLLRKFASIVASDSEEEESLYRELLKARVLLLIPPELYENSLKEHPAEKGATNFTEGMPPEFLEQLKADINYTGMSRVTRILGVPRKVIEEVLQGRRILSRESVIRMARAVDQPVSKYLALAGYIPDNLRKVLTEEANVEFFFRTVEKLPPDRIVKILNKIAELLEIYTRNVKTDTNGKESD